MLPAIARWSSQKRTGRRSAFDWWLAMSHEGDHDDPRRTGSHPHRAGSGAGGRRLVAGRRDAAAQTQRHRNRPGQSAHGAGLPRGRRPGRGAAVPRQADQVRRAAHAVRPAVSGPATPAAVGRQRPQPDGFPETGGIMMADEHTDGRLAGFTLGREEDAARAARIELAQAGETTRPFNRSMQRGERVVKIRCGADIKPQPITWLWPGWVPAGKLTILAGAAGTGKTTLALALAAVLTAGGRWPDGSACHGRGNVLIWSSEDVADDTLVPRLIASGADLARCHFIEGIAQDGESVPFDPSQDIPDLRRAVDAIGGGSLLLIDPIVSAVAGDMHRANDVRRSLQAVVNFADAHGCAVIGITHFAKGGAGKAPQDRVIGSQAFGALARMVLVTAKEEGSNRRVMARAKSNIAPDDGGVAYSLELVTIAGGIEATHAVWEGAIEGTAREILGDVEHDDSGEDGDARQDLERMLMDTLREAGGKMATKALQAEVRDAGHSWDAAKRLKKSLGIEAKKLSMGGAWIWCLPETSN